MVDKKMQLTFLVVLVTGVRSQESYGSSATSVVNPSSVSNLFQDNSRPSNTLPILDNPSGSSFSSGGSISSSSPRGSTFGSSPSFSPSFGSSSVSSSRPFSSSSTFDSSQKSFSSSSNSFPSSSSGQTFDLSSDSFSGGSSFGTNSFSGSSTGSSFGSSNSFSDSSSSKNSFGSGNSFGGSSSNSFSGGSSSLGSSGRSSGSANIAVPGGVDFSQATRTEDGRLCVIKQESVETVSKDPILECKHKDVEQCHYTYITYFKPAQEEACEENYEKSCQITFRQQAVKETVRKCYRPLEKVCNGQGEDVCRTLYESSCSTKYVEKGPGKFVGDTKCEKLPVRICGAGCVTEEGPEECHNKSVDSLVDVPEETCDLNPQKTCRLVTKLVPSLKPKQECTIVPQETCNLKFTSPKRKQKPLRTEWCLEDDPSPSYNPNARSGRRFRP